MVDFSRFINPYIIRKPDLPLPSALPANQPVDYTPPDDNQPLDFSDPNLTSPPAPPSVAPDIPPPSQYTQIRDEDRTLYDYINNVRNAESTIPVERDLMQRAERPHVKTVKPFAGAQAGVTVNQPVIPRGPGIYASPVPIRPADTFPGAPATSSFLLERGTHAVPPPPRLSEQQIQQRTIQKAGNNPDALFFAIGGTRAELDKYKTIYGEHPFGLMTAATRDSYPYLLSTLKAKVQGRLDAMRAPEAEAAATVALNPLEQAMTMGAATPEEDIYFGKPAEAKETQIYTPADVQTAREVGAFGAKYTQAATNNNVILPGYVPTEGAKRGDWLTAENAGTVLGMVTNLLGLRALTPAALSSLGPEVSTGVLFAMQEAANNPDPAGKMSLFENAANRIVNAGKGGIKGVIIGKLMGATPSLPREQLSMIAPGVATTVGKGIIEGESPEKIAANVSSESLPMALFPVAGRLLHGLSGEPQTTESIPLEPPSRTPQPTSEVQPEAPAPAPELVPPTLKDSNPNSANATVARQAGLYEEMKDMTPDERQQFKDTINARIGTPQELLSDRPMAESAYRVDLDIKSHQLELEQSRKPIPTSQEYMQELKNVYAPEAAFRPLEEARAVDTENAMADIELPPPTKAFTPPLPPEDIQPMKQNVEPPPSAVAPEALPPPEEQVIPEAAQPELPPSSRVPEPTPEIAPTEPAPVEPPPLEPAQPQPAPQTAGDKLRSIADRLEQEALASLEARKKASQETPGGSESGGTPIFGDAVDAAKLVAAKLLRGGANVADVVAQVHAMFGNKFSDDELRDIQANAEGMVEQYTREAATPASEELPPPTTEMPPPSGAMKERQTIKSAEPYFDSKIAPELYQELTNPESINASESLIRSDPEKARRLAMNEEATNEEAPLSNALSIGLISKAQQEARAADVAGDTNLADSKRQEATELIRAAAERSTRFGQEIQFLSLLNRVSPEGARLYAESQMQKAEREVVAKKPALPQKAKEEGAAVNKALNEKKTEAAAEAAQEVAARFTGQDTRRSALEKARAVREQKLTERKVKYDAKAAEWDVKAQAAIQRMKAAIFGTRMEAGGGQFLFDLGDAIVSKMMSKGLRKYAEIRNDIESAIGQKIEDRDYNKAAIEARRKYVEEMKSIGMPQEVIADPARIVAQRLRAKESATGQPDPVSELINNVVSLANERLLPKARSPKGYLDVLTQAAENRPEATALWEEAKTAAREKYKDDPDALARIEPFLNSDPGKLVSDPAFKQAVGAFVKSRGDNVADIVRNTLGKGDATRDDLITALTKDKGFSQSEAEEIADLARSQYDQMLKEKQTSIIEAATKTRVTKPVVEKTFEERKTDIKNLTQISTEEKTKAINAIERREADSLVSDKNVSARAPITKDDKIARIQSMETLTPAEKQKYSDRLEKKEQSSLLNRMVKEPSDTERGPSKTLQDKIGLVSSLDRLDPAQRADAVAKLERREFERLIKEPPEPGEKPDPKSRIEQINDLQTISDAEKENAAKLLNSRAEGKDERTFLNRILKDSKRNSSQPLTTEQKISLVENIKNATDAEKSTAIEKLKSDALQRMIAERPQPKLPPKTLADKMLEIQTAGGFDEATRNKETARLIAKKLGIPTLDADTAREIDTMAEQMQGMTDKDERDIASALMMMKIGEQLPPAGRAEKAREFVRIGKLLGYDTVARFFGRHGGFAGVEAALETPHAAIDAIVQRLPTFTGKRTQFVPDYKQMGETFVSETLKAAKNAYKYGIRPGQEGATSLIKPGAMTSRIGRGMRTLHDVLIASTPVGVQRSFYEQQLRNIKRGAGLGETDLPSRDMIVEAKRRSLEAAMQDPNFANSALSKIREAGNFIGLNGRIPIGDAIVLYSQAPGSSFVRSLEYGPGGFVKALYELGNLGNKTPTARQYDFGRAMTRGFFGTSALMSLGILGGATGLITDPARDAKAKHLQEKLGIKGHAWNVSGTIRRMMGGSAELQDDDHLIGYDWLEPFAAPINLGFNVLKAGQTGEPTARSVASAFLQPSSWFTGAGRTLEEEPLIAGLSQKLGLAKGRSAEETGRAFVADFPGLFIPSLFTQLRNDFDKQRDTYDPNLFFETVNTTMNNLPGFSKELPGAVDVFGEDRERANKIGKYNKSPEAEYGLELYKKTGPKMIQGEERFPYLPPSAPRTVTLNKPDGSTQEVTPSADQRREYQTYIGGAVKRLYGLANDSQYFKSLPADTQSKLITNWIQDIQKRGQIAVFGQRYQNQNEIIEGAVPNDPALFDHNAKVELAHSQADEFVKKDADYQSLSPDNQRKVNESVRDIYKAYKVKEQKVVPPDTLRENAKALGGILDDYTKNTDEETKLPSWQVDAKRIIDAYKQVEHPSDTALALPPPGASR